MNPDQNVDIQITAQQAVIENPMLAIQFDLKTGTYSGIDRLTGRCVFRDAWYRVGEGGWKEQALTLRRNL